MNSQTEDPVTYEVKAINDRWKRNQMEDIFKEAENFVTGLSLGDLEDVFKKILKNLESFGLNLLKEFAEEKGRQVKAGGFLKDEKLRGTSDQIYEFAVSAVFEQIGQDLTLISSAATQRASNTIKTRLEALDKQANSYLDTAVKAGFVGKGEDLIPDDDLKYIKSRCLPCPTIYTYFQKSPLMRVIPYSNYILVGLPYTCFPSEKEFEINAKIAREVGNLVFWQGYKSNLILTVTETPVSAKLYASLIRSMRIDGHSLWIARSVPIIFADLYALKAIMDKSDDSNWRGSITGLFDDILKVTTNLILANTYGDNINLRLPLELRPEVILIALKEFYPIDDEYLSLIKSKWEPIKKEGFGTKGYRKKNYTAPNRVEIYDKYSEFELSMDTALHDLIKAVKYIWKIINSPIPSSKLSYNSSLTIIDAVWADEKSVLDAMTEYGLAEPYNENLEKWFTLFYADGWVMQSPGGNSGPH